MRVASRQTLELRTFGGHSEVETGRDLGSETLALKRRALNLGYFKGNIIASRSQEPHRLCFC